MNITKLLNYKFEHQNARKIVNLLLKQGVGSI